MGIPLRPAFLIGFAVLGFLFFFMIDRLSKPK